MKYPKDRKRRPVRERFWEQVVKTPECWNWAGLSNAKGYGRFSVGGRETHRMVLAHRFAWELQRGDPGEQCVLHRCDNPRCVRLSHLFLGTRADNNEDMRRKGREGIASGDRSGRRLHPEQFPRGSECVHAKLDEDRVREIRRLYRAGGIGYIKLGRLFGVGHTTVENIVHRKKWAHVVDGEDEGLGR